MALKGQAKTDYQREYMRRRRADVRPPVRPKMGFEPRVRILDGKAIPGDACSEPVDFGA